MENMEFDNQTSWELFIKCQSVIEEQEQYISKLESDLKKKDIELRKLKNDRREGYEEELEDKNRLISKLNEKIQMIIHQNECLRIQFENKCSEGEKLKEQMSKMEQKIKENQQSLTSLKLLYEAKIQKLKEQIDESKHTSRSKISSYNAYTPIKPMNSRVSAFLTGKVQSTQEKTLKNTPYLAKGKNSSLRKEIFRTEEEDEELVVIKSKNDSHKLKVNKTLKELEKRMKIMAEKLANPEID